MPHSTRPDVFGAIHVVQRIARGLPELRTPRLLRVFERCFRACKRRSGFAIAHYSIQRDHLHMVVDVDDRHALARGMQALAIRLAKQLNRAWHRRGHGGVFAERYFASAPVMKWNHVSRLIRYVLSNGRKHCAWLEKDRPDPYSSGPWYRRWRQDIRRPLRDSPVAESLRALHHPPSLDINEAPAPLLHWVQPLGAAHA